MVKGRVEHSVFKASLPYQLHGLPFNSLIEIHARFQFYIDGKAGVLKSLQNLPKSGDSADLGILRPGLIHVKAFELLQGVIRHFSFSIAYPVNPFVVNHHDLPVL